MQATATTRAFDVVIPPGRWLLSSVADFFLLHGALGLTSLPIVLCAYFLPPQDTFLPFVLSQIILNVPHLAATYLRITTEDRCLALRRWLLPVAPILFLSLLCAIMIGQWLPYLMLFALTVQTWHSNRQNFGVMREYLRGSHSSPAELTNRIAEAAMELVPWAALCFACSRPASLFNGSPIYCPGGAVIFLLSVCLSVIGSVTLLSYIVLEIVEWSKGKLVPGRMLCVLASCGINVLAWCFVREISWAFLVVSIWHTLQYIAFVFYFRKSRGYEERGFLRYFGFVLLLGATVYGALFGIAKLNVSVALALSLTMSMHHQLSDSVIWRKRRVANT